MNIGRKIIRFIVLVIQAHYVKPKKLAAASEPGTSNLNVHQWKLGAALSFGFGGLGFRIQYRLTGTGVRAASTYRLVSHFLSYKRADSQ